MKTKILLLSVILLAVSGSLFAAPAITVSASAVTLLGTTQTISITCTLIDPNQTGNLRVTGTGIVPVQVTSTVTPGTTATVGPIYGNDVILDAFGNPNTTFYKVQVFTVTGGIIASTPSLQAFYAFTGSGTVDLSTATPLAPSFMSGANGSVVMPGALTVSGTGTFLNLNDILWVGPGAGSYNTIAAAVTAAGSTNKTIIGIRSTYAGTECPALQANLTFWDFRGGGAGGSPCVNNVVTWNGDDTSVHTFMRAIMQRNNPTDSDTALYGQCQYSGTFPSPGTGPALECVTAETDITGAVTPNSGTTVNSLEGGVVLLAQGGTIANVNDEIIGGNVHGSNTTNVTNWIDIRAQALTNGDTGGACCPGTGTIAHWYGFYGDDFTAATDNWSAFMNGPQKTLVKGGSGVAPAFIDHGVVNYNDGAHASGTGCTAGSCTFYGTVSVARQQSDAAGDKVFAGWFKANAQNSPAGDVGVHAEVDAGGTAAEFATAGTVKSSIDSNGVFKPAIAGGLDLGTAALPFSGVNIGSAATNNARVTGTFGQATVITLPDPAAGAATLAYRNIGNTWSAAQFYTGGSSISFSNILINATVPTIAGAGCGGSAASMVVTNGTAAFKINVGTTPTSACTFTMPAATTGWNVTCTDITTNSTNVFLQKQTGAESTTSVTITNFNDVAVATAFTASDILKCTAFAD